MRNEDYTQEIRVKKIIIFYLSTEHLQIKMGMDNYRTRFKIFIPIA